MAEPGRLTLRWGSSTDKGKARDANEDRFLANGRIFVVADGMGGHAAGEVAAQIAIDLFQRAGGSPDLETLVDLTQQANVNVYERALMNPRLRGMGTTVSGIAVVRPTLDDDADKLVDPVELVIAGHDEEGEAIEKELAEALADNKIGRASCRERVYSYV
jgi:serine/threonine protein phosphatase PrpC